MQLSGSQKSRVVDELLFPAGVLWIKPQWLRDRDLGVCVKADENCGPLPPGWDAEGVRKGDPVVGGGHGRSC